MSAALAPMVCGTCGGAADPGCSCDGTGEESCSDCGDVAVGYQYEGAGALPACERHVCCVECGEPIEDGHPGCAADAACAA